jgi:hypothetical protein
LRHPEYLQRFSNHGLRQRPPDSHSAPPIVFVIE